MRKSLIVLAACGFFAVDGAFCMPGVAADSAQANKADKASEELSNLRQEKLKAAEVRYNAVIASYKAETQVISSVYEASRDWKEAAYEQASSKKERLAALEDHRKRMTDLYQKTHALWDAGRRGGESDKDASAHFWELQAKIWVLEEKAKP